MNFSKLAIESAAKCKPVLVKIIPIEWLRAIRDKIVAKNTDNLKNANIKPYDSTKNKMGVNLIGNIRGDNGLGQSTRFIADILEHSDVNYTIHNFFVPPGVSMTNHTCDDKITEELTYNKNIIHINADEFTIAYLKMGRSVWDDRYNIAYWLWELEDFPQEWVGCIDLADEIWTPAEFISNTLRRHTDKPVYTVPYPMSAPVDDSFDREYFGLPKDRFLFLMMFDSSSIMERKNPLGAIESFKKAFGTDNDKVGLVIKANQIEDSDREMLEEILKGYDNIYLVLKTLTKVEINSLIKTVDVFVSLHRAEGFGLVLAEAMIVGTPTIATNWSANTEFMTKDVACMVDYNLIELKEDILPFRKGYKWADPDINQAAEYMKKLYEDKEYYNEIKTKATEYVLDKLSMKRAVELVERRLAEIDADCGKVRE